MIDAAAADTDLDQATLLKLINAVASHHGPLESRRQETPEAVALYPGKRAGCPRRRDVRQTLKRTFSTSPSATM